MRINIEWTDLPIALRFPENIWLGQTGFTRSVLTLNIFFFLPMEAFFEWNSFKDYNTYKFFSLTEEPC